MQLFDAPDGELRQDCKFEPQKSHEARLQQPQQGKLVGLKEDGEHQQGVDAGQLRSVYSPPSLPALQRSLGYRGITGTRCLSVKVGKHASGRNESSKGL